MRFHNSAMHPHYVMHDTIVAAFWATAFTHHTMVCYDSNNEISGLNKMVACVENATHYISKIQKKPSYMISHFLRILLSDIEAITSNTTPPNFNNDTTVYGPYWDNFLDTLNSNGCAYWENQYEQLFANKFVPDKTELEKRMEIPEAIQLKGAAAMAKHMEYLAAQGIRETKEARVIILGSAGAGKTSLVRKLHNSYAFLPRKSQYTTGVYTSKLKLIPGEVTHLWDFGGHVVARAAHKCFVSAECVYILVVDARNEEQTKIDQH